MRDDDDVLALSRQLDEIIRGGDEPREPLAELVRQHGGERVAEESRIVFASWRSRVDLVEEVLRGLLGPQGR